MYKEELIHLHQLMLYLMKFLVDNGVSKSSFKKYTELSISPHHIHRSKAEHKYAVFVLAGGISHVLADNSEIIPQSVSERLEELAERCKSEIV